MVYKLSTCHSPAAFGDVQTGSAWSLTSTRTLIHTPPNTTRRLERSVLLQQRTKELRLLPCSPLPCSPHALSFAAMRVNVLAAGFAAASLVSADYPDVQPTYVPEQPPPYSSGPATYYQDPSPPKSYQSPPEETAYSPHPKKPHHPHHFPWIFHRPHPKYSSSSQEYGRKLPASIVQRCKLTVFRWTTSARLHRPAASVVFHGPICPAAAELIHDPIRTAAA